MSKNRHFDAYRPVRIAAPIQKIENSFCQQQSIAMRESDCGEPAYWPQWDQDCKTSESASLAGYSEKTLLFNHLWHTGGIDFCVKWEDTPQHRPAKP